MAKRYTYHVVYSTNSSKCTHGCITPTTTKPIEGVTDIVGLMDYIREVNRLKPKVKVIIDNIILLNVTEVPEDAETDSQAT